MSFYIYITKKVFFCVPGFRSKKMFKVHKIALCMPKGNNSFNQRPKRKKEG